MRDDGEHVRLLGPGRGGGGGAEAGEGSRARPQRHAGDGHAGDERRPDEAAEGPSKELDAAPVGRRHGHHDGRVLEVNIHRGEVDDHLAKDVARQRRRRHVNLLTQTRSLAMIRYVRPV